MALFSRIKILELQFANDTDEECRRLEECICTLLRFLFLFYKFLLNQYIDYCIKLK